MMPHLTTSHSSVDLQECARLPIVIREKDIEYQVRLFGGECNVKEKYQFKLQVKDDYM